MTVWAKCAVLCGVLFVAASCAADEKFELFVDLQTDLVPGQEFAEAEVFLQRPGTLTPLRVERRIASTDGFIDPSRIAEFESVGAGLHRVVVHLRSSTGALVAERPASVEIRQSRLVTIVITRDCRGVTCDDPARSACLQGQCVPDTCTPENPETCPAPGCTMPGDCNPPPAACAEALCAAGACLRVTRVPPQCGSGLYCDPEFGCRASPTETPVDAGALDAGLPDSSMLDASEADAGTSDTDAGPPGPCWNGVLDGDETQIDCGGSCPTACSSLFDCDVQTDIPPSECWALVALYESTGGAAWTTNTSWLTGAPCGWFGVVCGAGHVSAIQLWGNQLRGSLPPELGNLRNLTHLTLFANELMGSLPPELGDMRGLVQLSLLTNQLTGSIPPELGSLSDLASLDVHSNQLSGSIPPELGNLSNLTLLGLQGNQLSGSIPPELGNLNSLTHFQLSYNELSGSIPPELGNLNNLTHLNLTDNQLSGSIPPELGNLSALGQLYLQANMLSGAIPAMLGNLSSVQNFDLSANILSGEVPPSLMSISGNNQFLLRGNGCLTATGATFLAWLAGKDPLWNDGC